MGLLQIHPTALEQSSSWDFLHAGRIKILLLGTVHAVNCLSRVSVVMVIDCPVLRGNDLDIPILRLIVLLFALWMAEDGAGRTTPANSRPVTTSIAGGHSESTD